MALELDRRRADVGQRCVARGNLLVDLAVAEPLHDRVGVPDRRKESGADQHHHFPEPLHPRPQDLGGELDVLIRSDGGEVVRAAGNGPLPARTTFFVRHGFPRGGDSRFMNRSGSQAAERPDDRETRPQSGLGSGAPGSGPRPRSFRSLQEAWSSFL